MKISKLLATSVAIAMVTSSVSAQDGWQPTQDVELVITYAPGGGADVFGRKVIEIIQTNDMVPVNVQPVNRPGGSSAVGIGYVQSRKDADPHTLVVLNIAAILTPLTVEGAPGWRELTPLVNMMAEDYVVFVPGNSEWQSIEDLASAAESGTVTFAVGGVGDSMAAGVVGNSLGVPFNQVRFDGGGESINAVLGGHVDATISNPLEFMGQVESGDLRALATTGRERLDGALSDIPTLTELGYEVPEFANWRGIAGPANMPDEAQEYWIDIMTQVAETEEFREYVEGNAGTVPIRSGADYADYIASQDTLFAELLSESTN